MTSTATATPSISTLTSTPSISTLTLTPTHTPLPPSNPPSSSTPSPILILTYHELDTARYPPLQTTTIIDIFTDWEPAFSAALKTLHAGLDNYLKILYPGITALAMQNMVACWRLDVGDKGEGKEGGKEEGGGAGEWSRRLSNVDDRVEFEVVVKAYVPKRGMGGQTGGGVVGGWVK